MEITTAFANFFSVTIQLLSSPLNVTILAGATFLGILFGAMPGLTATLGVALLTTLTYGVNQSTAMIALMAMYVGAVYGGSYSAVLLNIPGTAASAALAMDGYPLAKKGLAGKVLGLVTTTSAVGTIIGLLFVITLTPLIAKMALQFTSAEFFLLALFGIIISGTLTSSDLVIKGWIAGFIGLWMALIGRDALQTYPRFTLGIPELDGGLDIVPVLIGAFGIPQIIQVLKEKTQFKNFVEMKKMLPGFKDLLRNKITVLRSAIIGTGIGAVPGIGEDIAGWVAYGTGKNMSKHPEEYGHGSMEGIICAETSNKACIGGAMIVLLSLGIPGSPPAAMLLGALLLHGVQPGPMLIIENPLFITEMAAILLLSALAMWVIGMLLAKQVIKVLKMPQTLLMPIVAILCVIGSYALGAKIFNLYLMIPVGIISYFLTEMKYPVAPLVIGVILGPMADENLRRFLMVNQGDFLPIFTRPVSLILIIVIVLTIFSQTKTYKKITGKLFGKFKPVRTEAQIEEAKKLNMIE